MKYAWNNCTEKKKQNYNETKSSANSPAENQNDLELDFKVFFSLLILVV